ncbi:hypothetical protein [Pseudoclavibacter sp. VKM Ac-2888]|uniref:hypothetical protein n=1 Tax=Pseudoclavibacter sp. VKM Ac-2888 TaxID=2783830 RepID=UPI00188DA5DE|nr:hypothetical protein [Pseudoclavibacter sp. VKM Ac-2888]MBF4550948.1 hypothetical protein [Pseudoclavibacter sp. VKM Ac-2888]
MNSRTSRAPTRWASSALLRLGALAALNAVVALALAPVTTVLATVNPPAYAVVASMTMMLPMLAALLVPRFGSAIIVAFCTGIFLMITPLGAIAIVALSLPALVMELVLLLGRLVLRRSRPGAEATTTDVPWTTWLLACAAGGTAIAAMSLLVLAPGAATPGLVALLCCIRVLTYTTLGALMRRLRSQLRSAGLV